MSIVRYKSEDIKLTKEHMKELEELAKMPDSEIDYSDIPPLNPEDWKDATRGAFYRPIKKSVSLRVDSDVLAWFKYQGKGYQTRMNEALRLFMLTQMQRSKPS